MNPATNPYTPGAGDPPPNLVGREAIVQDATHAIQRIKAGGSAKSTILLGVRGVGKTVLLNEFETIADAEGCQTALVEAVAKQSLAELLAPQLQRILLKLSRLERVAHGLQRASGLVRGFASAFKVKVGEFEFGVTKEEPVTGDLSLDLSDIFVEIGAAAKARRTEIVLLIDELQYLVDNDLSALIVALHKTRQRKLPIVFFGAGLPQLAKLAGDAKSYAERLFSYPAIGPLDNGDAKRALTEPAAEKGATYTDDAIQYILEQTEGYPFFLQVWGAHTWDAAKTPAISLSDAHEGHSRAINDLDNGIFKSRFQRMTERQQQYARGLAEFGPRPARSGDVAAAIGTTNKKAGPIRDELIKKGMAYSPSRGLVAFTIPLFDAYMLRKMPLEKIPQSKSRSAARRKRE